PLYIHITAFMTTNNCVLRTAGQPCTCMASERTGKMVAVIDVDESYRVAVQRLLKSEGFSVQSFASAEDFLSSGQQHETGCLITDIRMPGMSGLDLQAKLNADHCPIPTIFITAHGDEDMRQTLQGWCRMHLTCAPTTASPLMTCVTSGSSMLSTHCRSERDNHWPAM